MYIEMEFDTQSNGGKSFIGIKNNWEKQWVYTLISHVVEENLDHIRKLEWFSLGQLLGDDVWQFLVGRNEHESARRCFEYMIEDGHFPIKSISKGIVGTHAYVVTE